MQLSERVQLRCVIALGVSLAMLIGAEQVVGGGCGGFDTFSEPRIDQACLADLTGDLERAKQHARRWGSDDPGTLRDLANETKGLADTKAGDSMRLAQEIQNQHDAIAQLQAEADVLEGQAKQACGSGT